MYLKEYHKDKIIKEKHSI